MSITDLPPHELRGPLGQVGDAGGGVVPGLQRPPVPNAIANGSPGIAMAAGEPPPTAPSFSADDPSAIAVLLAQIAGGSQSPSLFPLGDGGASVAPALTPSAMSSGTGAAAPGSPGIAPALIAASPASGTPSEPANAALPDAAPRAPFGAGPLDLSAVLAPAFGGGGFELPAEPQRLSIFDGAPAIDAAPNFLPSGEPAAPRTPTFELPHEHRPNAPAAPAAPVRDLGGNAFDPHIVRRDFPILEERVHGKRLVWLDNAATTQKPQAVIDRLAYFYAHENSNVHRAAHTLAARATDAYEGARETTRKFLNAPAAKDIVFVRGATEGINLIAKAWGTRNISAGDEIVLTHLEHHANIVPWQQLCAVTGAKLRVAPVDDRGDVILEEYEKLLGPRTKLVAFTQVSNALGTVTPARVMVEMAHRQGAIVLVDGAQAVSHMPVDVQALDCDFYVFSGHKVFAPTGIGAVYGKRAILDAMPPWQGGGNMIADVTFERTMYQPPPWRFEAGTGNIADAAGLGTALDYVMRIGMHVIERYEHELLVYATDCLATVRGLRMIGTSPTKAGVLSFVIDGHRTEDLGAALDQEGIAVRSGHHCAQPILRRFGVESSVRASLAFYNVREDIDALVDALRRLAPGRA